jgi:adenylate kinase family enzyme
MPNVVEAYTDKKGKSIILFSGLSGSGKSKIAKFIAEKFNYKITNLNDFYYSKETYDKPNNYVELDDKKILDWDNIYESVNWDKLNEHVNMYKNKGLIIYGLGFPTKLLKFKPDYHFLVKISKPKLLENREKYLKKQDKNNKDDKDDKDDDIQEQDKEFIKKINKMDIDKKILNKITYPHYLNIITDSKIDKYLEVDKMTTEELYKDVFDFLIKSIISWLKKFDTKRNKNREFNKSDTYDGKTNTYYEGKSQIYDPSKLNGDKCNKYMRYSDGNDKAYDWYYHNNKRVINDFNEQGIPYSQEYLNKVKKDCGDRLDSSSYQDSSDFSDKHTSDSNQEYLFTRN